MREATKAPKISFYDYIVIGGGTTGIPLATTLSANYSVLLLECGGSPYGNPNITSISNFGSYLMDTSPTSPSQQFISEGVVNARPRVLGGGTSINAGFYSRRSRPLSCGVVFRDSLGIKHRAYLRGRKNDEIILSAGALGSPQLLVLSGIGPKEQLDAQKIKAVLTQPFVGKGMADNPQNPIFVPSPIAVEQSLIQVVGITRFGSYIEGIGGYNIIFENPSSYQGFFPQMGGFIFVKPDGPLSMGELRIENSNPADNPSVTFNYFKEPEDLQKCVDGIRTILKVVETKAFSNYKYANMTVKDILDLNMKLPMNLREHGNTSSSLEQYCKDTVRTIYHYHGGCHIEKVVSPEYKVFGVDALRVIDGSTLLNSPGTNPQASLLMLGSCRQTITTGLRYRPTSVEVRDDEDKGREIGEKRCGRS
ncbi:hypothetical protein L1987_77318 [Smallanthus sonchifolius]|uniref:Uncharacterized protein n=1 Tax=Smallanthus sonchifolius TaxID=185202 RepID=A0ACB8ZAI8_9ASTR|nr:hypothetical protein L1987_77318 [Smallanthus sonchifolius]